MLIIYSFLLIMIYSLILACTIEGGIGLNNKIPWYIPEDLKLFKKITTDINCYIKRNAVIMGRKTWESLPNKPLNDRINIIITSNPKLIDTNKADILAFSDLNDALNYCNDCIYIDKVFVIGGKSIYDKCLNNNEFLNKIDYIHLSLIKEKKKCDTFVDLKLILRKFRNYNIHDIVFNANFMYLKLINIDRRKLE